MLRVLQVLQVPGPSIRSPGCEALYDIMSESWPAGEGRGTEEGQMGRGFTR